MDINKEIKQHTKCYTTWKDWCIEMWDAIAFIILGIILIGMELCVGVAKVFRNFKQYIMQTNKDLEELWR